MASPTSEFSRSDEWPDVVQYTRQAKAHGGEWVCTLHMHNAENIVVGKGLTQRGAEADALQKAGKPAKRSRIHGLPTWPMTAVALFAAGLAGIEASLAINQLQLVASVIASLTAIRLLIERR